MKPLLPWPNAARRAGVGALPLLLFLCLAAPSRAEDPEEPASTQAIPEAPPAPPPELPLASSLLSADGEPPVPAVDETVEDTDPRALTEFRARLAPHGTWVTDPTYGEVWVPSRRLVGPSFAPYVSSGRWAAGDGGTWVWVSDYPFGDVVFHYGRWAFTRYGWAWIPGYRYASAWVEWRGPSPGHAYYGWSPVPPTFVWVSGVAVWAGGPSPYYWVFCPSAHVFSPYPRGYLVTHPHHLRTLSFGTRHYVPAWPLPRASGATATRSSSAFPRQRPASLSPVRHLPPDSVRPLSARRWIPPTAHRAALPTPPPRRKPRPLERVRRADEVVPARVVAPAARVYSPGHGNGAVRRR